jgi:ElaA protein
MDGADAAAMHLLGTSGGRLVAYARCLAAGVKFKEASIGRIITRSTLRGSGAGHVLVRRAIECIAQQWGPQTIRLGAQARLEHFYRQHGFETTGEPYIEDGIPHIEMLRP